MTFHTARRKRFAPRVYADLIQKQDGKCACGCEQPLVLGMIEWDHIIALELGGRDEPSNLQGLLKRHHKPKTREDMAKIAKVRRIIKKQRRLNVTEREVARILEKSA